MKVLVTGGAGYIGSHTIKALLKEGHKVVVYDSLQNGHKEALSPKVKFVKGSLSDIKKLNKVFIKNNFNAVVHLASNMLVNESFNKPLKYYGDLINGWNLLSCMLNNNVKKIIFSSSASVYGEPKKIPLKETAKINPISPYGEYKATFEQMLKWCEKAHNLEYTSLRYFNAAGADPSGKIGESHKVETHLIPLILKVALRQIDSIKIFGTNYKTKDGTCIRDYIHVNDLANAHILALNALDKGSKIYNLGNEKGYSVKEIIIAARLITKKEIKSIEFERRPGDPAILVASSKKIKKELGWKPQYSNINTIIETAWNWHKTHPNGFSK